MYARFCNCIQCIPNDVLIHYTLLYDDDNDKLMLNFNCIYFDFRTKSRTDNIYSCIQDYRLGLKLSRKNSTKPLKG